MYIYTRNPQPSTLNPQPSTLNPQPSTLNPQPSTHNPQPSTLSLQPSNLNSQPSTLKPKQILKDKTLSIAEELTARNSTTILYTLAKLHASGTTSR